VGLHKNSENQNDEYCQNEISIKGKNKTAKSSNLNALCGFLTLIQAFCSEISKIIQPAKELRRLHG
jgi:hypothetical protein